ncbi:hypothetical protein RA307_20020 [Xanthobacteraceae bacterium Astr-EGSB]|uniref:hypothetical protein n=1 Tax=Astrobacterium formosum TaxID=3069710 RepID=UPI0027B1CB51|nr:hypothetical protein [Xanthobacteraceae bacterium Astr-EGSB]
MTTNRKKSDTVSLTLDRDVALVLFDFLARTADEEEGEPLQDALLHKAELAALLELFAGLEEMLEEPFAADYTRLVDAARDRVEEARGTGRV